MVFLDGDKGEKLKNGYIALFAKLFMSFSKRGWRKKTKISLCPVTYSNI